MVTLGATVVSSDAEVWIPTAAPNSIFIETPPEEPPSIKPIRLSPRRWKLEAWAVVPDALYRYLGANPELAQALKSDLADSLARDADAKFLGELPRRDGAAESLLETVLDIVTEIRGKADVDFRSPGWILNPATLDKLTRSGEPGGDAARTLDTFRLLTLDGADGGTLVGLPFVTSGAATKPEIYFAADWGDAWVAVRGTPVTIDTPVEPSVVGAVVIRASMNVGFALRRKDGFAWANDSNDE